MANDLTCNPLVVDTAAATAILSGHFKITNIRWVDTGNDIADADRATLKNSAGKIIWDALNTTVGVGTTTQPGGESTFFPPLGVAGLICSALTHGTLYIYFDGAQPKV